MWIATSAGLGRLHAGKITNYTTADGLSSNAITALLARHDGTLLIGTADHAGISGTGAHSGLSRAATHSTPPVPAILDDRLGPRVARHGHRNRALRRKRARRKQVGRKQTGPK